MSEEVVKRMKAEVSTSEILSNFSETGFLSWMGFLKLSGPDFIGSTNDFDESAHQVWKNFWFRDAAASGDESLRRKNEDEMTPSFVSRLSSSAFLPAEKVSMLSSNC